MERFLKGAADSHGFTDRLHCRSQSGVGAWEFFEGEARNLSDDIVDRRLKAGRRLLGDVVLKFVQAVTDCEFRCDLSDREACCFRCEGGGARDAWVHLDHYHATIGRVDGELDVRTTSLDADFADTCERCITHQLILFIS